MVLLAASLHTPAGSQLNAYFEGFRAILQELRGMLRKLMGCVAGVGRYHILVQA